MTPQGRRRALVAVGVFTVTFGAIAVHASHELDGRNLSNGRSLYAEQCASCHGADLGGQPDWRTENDDGLMPAPPHDETGHTWHHDNGLLHAYTRLGGQVALEQRGVTGFKSGMPGFADTLSDEDIWDVLAFIRSTWPKRVQEMQSSRNPPHNN